MVTHPQKEAYILKELQPLLVVEEESGQLPRPFGRAEEGNNIFLQVDLDVGAANVNDINLGHGTCGRPVLFTRLEGRIDTVRAGKSEL